MGGYALAKIQTKGRMFVKVGDDVYEGMIIGEMGKGTLDMDVNPCKEGQDANACRDAVGWHAAGIMNTITRPLFEEALSWMEDDELVEITPNHIRLRKAVLGW